MKQVIQHYRSGNLSVEEVPAPTVQPGSLLVATRSSLISVGTERATVGVGKKNLMGKAMDRPDLVRKVLDKAQKDGVAETLKMVASRLDAPVALGYSCAGIVLEVGSGVIGFSIGDRVACAGQNHASHAEIVSVPKNLCVKIPDPVEFDDAAYVTLGAIALQSVRQADPKLGDVVGVIGLGLVGQLVVQLLSANGCRVLAADPDEDKRSLALEHGAERCVHPDTLGEIAAAMTEGHGVDAVIVAASSKDSAPIAAAGDIARKKGRVVVVGLVGMNVPREPYYEKELDLRLSMSYGPGRYDSDYEQKGQDYPYAYVRWTERRNMSAFLRLIAERRIALTPLTRYKFPIEQAEQAYAKILSTAESPLGILLSYGASESQAPKRTLRLRTATPVERVRLGLIGAGNHVKDMLVPTLQRLSDVEIAAVCTQRGVNAKSVGQRLQAALCTTDHSEILADDSINAVLIGTRHDLHGPLVLDTLRAGKHVFVEKPLCLSEPELDEIVALYGDKAKTGQRLAVGFNRRFSPHMAQARELFAGRENPLVMLYRVNAGNLPTDHWTQDLDIGGGRIVGEACHFVDYLQVLCGARVVSVHAQCIGEHASGITQDQAVLSLCFGDGSVGTIVYAAGGDPALAKERCEAFGDGRCVVMEDFARTELYRHGRRSVFKTKRRDKGFDAQMMAFRDSIMDEEADGMPFDDIVSVTRTCLRALDSMRTGVVQMV